MNRKRIIVLAIIVYIFIYSYDIKFQVKDFEREINRLPITEMETQYGTEIFELYSLVLEGEYSQPSYSYVKWNKNQYLIDISSIKYGENGIVLDSKSVDFRVNYKSYLGIEILDL